MAMILLIQLSDRFYSPKHSEITQKKIKQLYYDKTTVNLWLPWLQEHGNSKRILRQMLMVKLLDIINVNSQQSFTGL